MAIFRQKTKGTQRVCDAVERRWRMNREPKGISNPNIKFGVSTIFGGSNYTPQFPREGKELSVITSFLRTPQQQTMYFFFQEQYLADSYFEEHMEEEIEDSHGLKDIDSDSDEEDLGRGPTDVDKQYMCNLRDEIAQQIWNARAIR
ncbi:hypothetical protein KY284_026343 [Solanum tuberosum]|nr:hypothetical protein KY284_026343 [Solanum tuberosum]